jgi:hypothetical protein
MDSHSHFHRKKVGQNLLVAYSATKQIAFWCDEYGEKATPRGKLLKRIVEFRRNVTYFAGNLCSVECNWHVYVHSKA